MGQSSGSCVEEIRRLEGVHRASWNEQGIAAWTLYIANSRSCATWAAKSNCFLEGWPLVCLLARQVRKRIQPVDDVPDMFLKIQVVTPAFWHNGVKWSVPKTTYRGLAWPTRHHLHSGRHSDLWQDIGRARWEPAKVLRAMSGDRHQTQQRQAGRRTERGHLHGSRNHEGIVTREPSWSIGNQWDAAIDQHQLIAPIHGHGELTGAVYASPDGHHATATQPAQEWRALRVVGHNKRPSMQSRWCWQSSCVLQLWQGTSAGERCEWVRTGIGFATRWQASSIRKPISVFSWTPLRSDRERNVERVVWFEQVSPLHVRSRCHCGDWQ